MAKAHTGVDTCALGIARSAGAPSRVAFVGVACRDRRGVALRRLVVFMAVLGMLLTLGMGSASAITDGELDGNRHPYVGLMVAQDAKGTPLWRCSGTLLAPR
jgi:hypothetical protein